ncbi:MAG: hypothetical protein ACOZAO_02340 [Patescibacteria group bacterium]
MQEVILSNYALFLKVHFIGFIIGLGAATVSDYLFIRSIKDLKITESEYNTITAVTHLVWAGIALFTLSGLTMFYANMEHLLHADSFLAKVTIVAIVVLNGIFMHKKIIPNLRKISFNKEISKKEHAIRLKTLIAGAISLTSWYSALFLAINKGYGYNYIQIMSVYFLVLFAGTAFCFLLEKNIYRMGKWKK